MKQLYYIRHGESFVNVGGVWATQVGNELDTGLTQLGREQAEAAGKQAAQDGLHFDLVLVSPLVRAQETADILMRHIGYDKSETYEPIRERSFGDLEGTKLEDFFATHVYKDIDEVNHADTIEALQKRADTVLKYVQSRPEASILLVSHAAFGRALKRAVRGLPYTAEYTEEKIEIPHAEVVQLLP